MGAFYNSIQVRGENRDAVKTALESFACDGGKRFLLGPALDGWIAIYPDDSGQDERCTTILSKRLNTIVLCLTVYDSDLFFYNFIRNGELLNEFSSSPDYFEQVSSTEHQRLQAKPELFRGLVGSPEQFAEITQLLECGDNAPKFDFEEHRMEKFAALLGIRNTLTSYEYLTQGEHDGITGWEQFIHVPDRSADHDGAAGQT